MRNRRDAKCGRSRSGIARREHGVRARLEPLDHAPPASPTRPATAAARREIQARVRPRARSSATGRLRAILIPPAAVAQLVEHFTRNEGSPARPNASSGQTRRQQPSDRSFWRLFGDNKSWLSLSRAKSCAAASVYGTEGHRFESCRARSAMPRSGTNLADIEETRWPLTAGLRALRLACHAPKNGDCSSR